MAAGGSQVPATKNVGTLEHSSSVGITNKLMGGPPWRVVASLENISGDASGRAQIFAKII